MDFNLYLSFIVVSVGLIILPGPNIVIIVSNSLNYGKKCGFQTVAGTSLAMAVQLTVSSVATAWFVQILSDGMSVLKYGGIVYLLYLAIRHLKSALYNRDSIQTLSAAGTFYRGFLVSLSNPKTLLFFIAFLPQFVSENGVYGVQISVLAVSFLMIAILIDSSYVFLSVRLRAMLNNYDITRIHNLITALLFLGFSVYFAVSDTISFQVK